MPEPTPFYLVNRTSADSFSQSSHPLYGPPRSEPSFWAGQCHTAIIGGTPCLSHTESDWYSRGLKASVAVWNGMKWEGAFGMRREVARSGMATQGTKNLGRMAVAEIDGLWFAAYAATDRYGRSDIWWMWADSPASWNPRAATPLATPDWRNDIPGQSGGRMDPTVVVDEAGVSLLYVGVDDAGRGATFRARWNGSGWEPERQQLFPLSGCAAWLARVTGVVPLSGGRRVALVDVAADQESISRPTATWVPVPTEQGLSGIRFGEPLRAAPDGMSCQYGAGLWVDGQLWTFYQTVLTGRYEGAQGVCWSAHERGAAEAGLASAWSD
jgi:hypothetical protein